VRLNGDIVDELEALAGELALESPSERSAHAEP
jgi:hypothetical protein